MNKTLSTVLIVVVLVLGIGGAYYVFTRADEKTDTNTTQQTSTSEQSTGSTPTNQAEIQETQNVASDPESKSGSVAVKNFAFSPNVITVKKGTTVTWTNEDSAEHNVFSDQEGGPKGELLKKGESYSFTFNKVGTFNYICTPHPHMKGAVTVTD